VYLLVARLFKVSPRAHLALLVGGLVLVVVVGGGLFALSQGFPFTTGLYWAITTATTVGYGDVIPHNPTGRIVASVVMLTAIPMLGALFAVVAGASVSAGVRRIMQLETHFPDGTYRLVVGSHPTVPAILGELVEAGDAVILVADVDATTVPDAVHLVRGDPTDPAVIRRARPGGAQHVLVTAGTDAEVLMSAVLLRQQAPGVAMTALTHTAAVRHALDALGVDQTVSVDDLVAHTLAKCLETPHAGRLIEELIDSDTHTLVETTAGAGEVGALLSAIRRAHGGLVLGLVRDGTVHLGVADDPVVATGDRLLVAEANTARRPVLR
jgi:voltage-gated potassium channel